MLIRQIGLAHPQASEDGQRHFYGGIPGNHDHGGGNWYYSPDLEKEGWLCPALFKYFDEAPEKIYARFEAKD